MEEPTQNPEDGDSVSELHEMPARPKTGTRRRRTSVSAPPTESLSMSTPVESYEKDDETKNKIKAVLKSNFIFSQVEGQDLETLIGAFFEVKKQPGEKIITQGEEGDNFYVLVSGTCDIFVSMDGSEPLKVLSITDEGYFGELALMYMSPRAATVIAETEVTLFALGGDSFHRVLRMSGGSRREEYDTFLRQVPLLQALDAEERGKIADVLVSASFEDGEYIIRQGETGKHLHFVHEGAAVATLSSSSGGTSELEVAQYEKGAYFGEIALLHDVPRKANVIARGGCRTLSIDRASFVRLLGPCLAEMTYHMNSYIELERSAVLQDLQSLSDNFSKNLASCRDKVGAEKSELERIINILQGRVVVDEKGGAGGEGQ